MAKRDIPTKDWTIQFLLLKALPKGYNPRENSKRTWEGVHVHPMGDKFSYYTDLKEVGDASQHTLEDGMHFCKLIMEHWVQVQKDDPREWAVYNRKTKERIILSQLVG